MKLVVPFFAALLAAGSASAASLSFSGSFSGDADVVFLEFTVESTSDVIIQSFGYGGGTQADGTDVSAGGFDTMVTLFDGSGMMVYATPGFNDDGLSGTVAEDPDTMSALDFYLATTLEAGDYTAAVSHFFNSSGFFLTDAFSQSDPNFTSTLGTCPTPMSQFCDKNGVNRSSNWAVDISGDGVVGVVPVPAGLALLLTGIAGFGALRRLKRL